MSGYDVRIEKGSFADSSARAEAKRPSDPARAERARTLIVLGLTLACTCMAFVDLLLLAGSS
jgi:hypothetical protein